MPNEFEKALSVISKPPDKRQDEEIRQLVPWLRSKAKLFKGIKANILVDIIRNCNYTTKERDEIVIKQGDIGDCFYITLSGKVSIYIFNKDQMTSDGPSVDPDDDESDAIANIIHYNNEGVLDRGRLGNFVISLEAGAPFGDVALTSGDSIRTASIVADIRTDLLVVDRALYNRSVKEVLAKEFLEKTTFIKNNPLFSTWPAKYRKQLAMALYKETFGYESTLARQGDRTSDMYFILSGQVEIQMEAGQHKLQYPQYFQVAKENDMDRLIRKVQKPAQHRERNLRAQTSQQQNGVPSKMRPHSANAKRRDTASKCMRLCHLGVNESVGDVELTMSLNTYMQTAVCRETTEVLVLEGKHYDRLFVRRHPRTIEAMRDQIGVKLESRMSLVRHKADIPFLDHLQARIASRHKPTPQTDFRDVPSVSAAEREFLNHKGPLIDQHGPGSVFYLIKLRELTRMRLKAKRGERMERIERIMKANHRRNLPSNVLRAAADEINALPQDDPSNMRPVSSIGGYDSRQAHALSYRGIRSARARKEEEERRMQEEEEEEEEEERRRATDEQGDYVEEDEQLPTYRSTSSRSMELEGAQEQDARLSFLEEKVRRWLKADNPKGKPQVAQLRRLPVDEMEFQPRPGNKVYVRKRDRNLNSQNTSINLARIHINTSGSKDSSNNSNKTATTNSTSIPTSPRVKKSNDVNAYSILLSR